MKHLDEYHTSAAYLLSLDVVCRKHTTELFDFYEDIICPEGLKKAWQTSTSSKTTRLLFNLWNGYCTEEKDGYEEPQGVQRELEKLNQEIEQKKKKSEKLDKEIDKKIDDIESLDVTVWANKDFLQRAERNRQDFIREIEKRKKNRER